MAKKKQPKPKYAKGFKRKVSTINRKLREFGETFGYMSKEYRDLSNLVLTHLGVSPKNPLFSDYFSSSPLQILPSYVERYSITGENKDPTDIYEISESLKTTTVFKKVKDKYSKEILQLYNDNHKDKKEKFTEEFFKKNKKYIISYVKKSNILSTLTSLIENLPNYYAALDDMDSTTQATLRKRFSDYGDSYKDGKRDDTIAQEIIKQIDDYFDVRKQTGDLIKKAEKIVEEDDIIEQNLQHNPVKFGYPIEDDEDDNPDWGSAVRKLR